MDSITAANIPLFFESTKFVKQILHFLLQNKSNKANWTNKSNWTNWTPDARGWTPGGPAGRGGTERGDKPDTIRRNGQTNKQTKLCAGATENTTKKRLEVRD